MYQQAAWIISVVLILFVIFVFLYVVAHSGQRVEYEPIQKKGYRIRNVWFLAAIAAMGLATFYTLRDLPFERPAHAANPTVVQVKARQFGFVLSRNEFRVGEPIAFQVTSGDVNHGVGIYDENMELLAQTQAMPKYTNPIYYTFEKPGTYQVLCLEYCGIGHHVMTATITVVPAQEGEGK
ncbi:cytochrome C oxidase subunit II [Geobacillus subterraneus]|uniref:cytochrome C oxidase subunit II n=1 Tax=Geobacillus subterraneus TaxID=129338 RepID=UPI00162310EA